MTDLNELLHTNFAGRVVRKDLTTRLKEGANVPVYVLEYLLGMYCATFDEMALQIGLERVKKVLSENYVRPDEAEKVKSRIRELGSYTVIDRLSVKLNERQDRYEARFDNLGIQGVIVQDKTVTSNEKLLAGGIWCIVQLEYAAGEDPSPFLMTSLKPIQMPNLDMQEVLTGRAAFTRDEWIAVLLRGVGLEPESFTPEAQRFCVLKSEIVILDHSHGSVPFYIFADSTSRRQKATREYVLLNPRISVRGDQHSLVGHGDGLDPSKAIWRQMSIDSLVVLDPVFFSNCFDHFNGYDCIELTLGFTVIADLDVDEVA